MIQFSSLPNVSTQILNKPVFRSLDESYIFFVHIKILWLIICDKRNAESRKEAYSLLQSVVSSLTRWVHLVLPLRPKWLTCMTFGRINWSNLFFSSWCREVSLKYSISSHGSYLEEGNLVLEQTCLYTYNKAYEKTITCTCKCQSDSVVVPMGSFTFATSNKEVSVWKPKEIAHMSAATLKLTQILYIKKRILNYKEKWFNLRTN